MKDQIIKEIKRVATELDANTLTEKQFTDNSTISVSSVRYYLGNWNRALTESGLSPLDADSKRDIAPKNQDDLLRELLRLNEDTGEIPTVALVNKRGKFAYQHYGEKWKSLAEAFELAKEKFPKKQKPLEVQKSKSNEPTEPELDLLNEIANLESEDLPEDDYLPEASPSPGRAGRTSTEASPVHGTPEQKERQSQRQDDQQSD